MFANCKYEELSYPKTQKMYGRYKTQVTGHKTCEFVVSSYFGSYVFTQGPEGEKPKS